jgi:hypothetical protein
VAAASDANVEGRAIKTVRQWLFKSRRSSGEKWPPSEDKRRRSNRPPNQIPKATTDRFPPFLEDGFWTSDEFSEMDFWVTLLFVMGRLMDRQSPKESG